MRHLSAGAGRHRDARGNGRTGRARWPAFYRLIVAPFEAAIAVTLIISGVAAAARLGPADPVTALLPAWETYALAVLFFLAGAGTITGVASANVAVEAGGLLLLCGSLIIRLILYAWYLGTDTTFALTGMLDALFVLAAFTRLLTARSRKIVITVRSGA